MINELMIHCSASPHDYHDDIEVIRKWHVEERGFKDVGYHFFVKKDGTIQNGRKLSKKGAHCRGHNDTIGVCLGGMGGDTISQLQFKSLIQLIIDGDYEVITQHSKYDKKKPHCAGINPSQMKYLNSLVR